MNVKRKEVLEMNRGKRGWLLAHTHAQGLRTATGQEQKTLTTRPDVSLRFLTWKRQSWKLNMAHLLASMAGKIRFSIS